MKMRALAGAVAVLAAFVALVAGPSGTAFADSASTVHQPATNAQNGPEIATYNGQALNLAEGWGTATGCVVWHTAGILKCFSSTTQLNAWEAQYGTLGETPTSGSSGVMPDASCSTPLNLYQDVNYGGRHLVFYDRGYWQNLSTYSFNDQTSAYIVGACGSHLAENANGGGYWYPGNTNAGSAVPWVGASWNDRISSIYIS